MVKAGMNSSLVGKRDLQDKFPYSVISIILKGMIKRLWIRMQRSTNSLQELGKRKSNLKIQRRRSTPSRENRR